MGWGKRKIEFLGGLSITFAGSWKKWLMCIARTPPPRTSKVGDKNRLELKEQKEQ